MKTIFANAEIKDKLEKYFKENGNIPKLAHIETQNIEITFLNKPFESLFDKFLPNKAIEKTQL